ncbi:hypothetical protein Ciccas_006565 [Cichlidogyrus casuarinus]|uniref:RNA helicase n=1 Tax=Cichlidogyrus casuarinus TaxID=1844966 RepID=A0ABD2Q5F2_9PLAT
MIGKTQDVEDESNLLFEDLHLKSEVLSGLKGAGFLRPSPIQARSIPPGLLGLDLIVQAKSGTGKTIVFCTIALEALDLKNPDLQVLILAPTREVAYQCQLVLRTIGSCFPKLALGLFVGGVALKDDLKRLKKCQIAIGTPGRVKYLIESKHMQTMSIKLFILDEADILFGGDSMTILDDDKNIPDDQITKSKNTFPATINWIWWQLPERKQVLALSATYSNQLVEKHLPRYVKNPILIRLAPKDPTLIGVAQYFHVLEFDRLRVPPNAVMKEKLKFLCDMLSSLDFKQCIIFSNFHSIASDICTSLQDKGWPVMYISGNLEQSERFDVYESLRSYQCRVLVSTDLTSRGVDAVNVDLVVSLEVPWKLETYLHRVGRAGRFGGRGAAITLVANANSEFESLKMLVSQLRHPLYRLPKPLPSNLATEPAESFAPLDMLHLSITQPRNVPQTVKKRVPLSTPKVTYKESSLTAPFKLQELKRDRSFSLDMNEVPQIDERVFNRFSDYMNLSIPQIIEQFETPNPTKVAAESNHKHTIEEPYFDIDSRPLTAKQRFFKEEYLRLSEWCQYYYQQYLDVSEQLQQAETELKILINQD